MRTHPFTLLRMNCSQSFNHSTLYNSWVEKLLHLIWIWSTFYFKNLKWRLLIFTSLTNLRRVEKLIIVQLVKKFLASYGILEFITVFTESRPDPNESSRLSNPISLRYGFFFLLRISGYNASISDLMRAIYPVHLILPDTITFIMFEWRYKLWTSLCMHF
jgi:hypothetical protein